MVIHTKEKAKIHAHEPKGAKIKGSNIYTVERGSKTIGAKVSDDKKKSYRKSTIHQSEPKNKGLSRFKRNYRESNTSIKTKNTNLHIAGRTGALAAGAVTEQVEGGRRYRRQHILHMKQGLAALIYGEKGLSSLPIQDITGEHIDTDNEYMYYYSVEFIK